jgi:hypothetical protein
MNQSKNNKNTKANKGILHLVSITKKVTVVEKNMTALIAPTGVSPIELSKKNNILKNGSLMKLSIND